jgi:hypothetical protein
MPFYLLNNWIIYYFSHKLPVPVPEEHELLTSVLEAENGDSLTAGMVKTEILQSLGMVGAIKTGSAHLVEMYMKENPGAMDETTGDGFRPIHVAARAGNLDMIMFMLSKSNREALNSKARDGSTPLHEAATQGHKDIVEYLLRNAAEVNPKDRFGRTPLRWAEENQHGAVVRLLKKYGGWS